MLKNGSDIDGHQHADLKHAADHLATAVPVDADAGR
jgi:hypothetical protein